MAEKKAAKKKTAKKVAKKEYKEPEVREIPKEEGAVLAPGLSEIAQDTTFAEQMRKRQEKGDV